MHQGAQHTGLVEAIDQHVEVLEVALPYDESDHVLGIAYTCSAAGRVQDVRCAGPISAAGSTSPSIEALRAAINAARVRVWRVQPDGFSEASHRRRRHAGRDDPAVQGRHGHAL